MSPSAKNYIGTALIALGIFIFMAIGMPQFSRISQTKDAIKEREALLAERQGLIAKIKSIQIEYNKRKTEVDRFGAIIPSKKSSAEIVSAIENISSGSGLQLSGLMMSNAKDDSNTVYDSINMEITVNGQYPALFNFLGALEQNLRLMDVSSVEAGLAPSASGQQVLSFKVKANAYFVK